jgi:hypothetical protein
MDDGGFNRRETEYVPDFTSVCRKCGEEKDTVEEQYSYGVYAGKMCRECAINGYRDHCGLLDDEQGDPRELEEMGEVYWEEDY